MLTMIAMAPKSDKVVCSCTKCRQNSFRENGTMYYGKKVSNRTRLDHEKKDRQQGMEIASESDSRWDAGIDAVDYTMDNIEEEQSTSKI